MEKNTLDRTLSVLLTGAALVIAVILLARQLGFRPMPNIVIERRDPRFVPDVHNAISGENAYVFGSPNGDTEVLVFFDMECPFCATFFRETLVPFMDTGLEGTRVSLVHFPLPSHRFAEKTAKMVDCAFEQNRVLEMLDLLYRKQDSLGLKAWSSFASAVGVPDIGTYEKCVGRAEVPARVSGGLSVARKAEIPATPTVIVNGWEFSAPPTLRELVSAIEQMRRGQRPFR